MNDWALIAIDTQTDCCLKVDLNPPVKELQIYGFTGLAVTPNGYVLGAQGEKSHIIQTNYSFHIENIVDHVLLMDVHGLLSVEKYLYVVSTGLDRILLFSLPDLNVSKVISFTDRSPSDPIYSPQGATDRVRGNWHLNDITLFQGRPVASRFGTRRSNTVRVGEIIDINDGKVLFSGLREPHSVTQMGAGLIVLESATGELLKIEPDDTGALEYRVLSQFQGYPRGLAIGEQAIAVGRSGFREKSRSGLDDCRFPICAHNGDHRTAARSGVFYQIGLGTPFKFFDLSKTGREVYGVLMLDGRLPAHYRALKSLFAKAA